MHQWIGYSAVYVSGVYEAITEVDGTIPMPSRERKEVILYSNSPVLSSGSL